MAERGPQRARLSDVAQRAGVAKSLLYQHFASKDALLVALVEHHGAAMLSALAANGQHGDASDRLRSGLQAIVTYANEHPAAWQLLFVGRLDDPLANRARRQILDAGSAAIAQRFAAELQAQRIAAAPAVPEMLAVLSRSAVDGLIAWWYDHPEVPAKEIVAVAHRYLLAALRGWVASSVRSQRSGSR